MIKHKKVEAAEKPENVDYEMNKLGFEIRLLIGQENRLAKSSNLKTHKSEFKFFNERANCDEKFKI